MERLTIRNSDGSISQPTHSTFEKVFKRLAEYEDTGLDPDEIETLKLDYEYDEGILINEVLDQEYSVEITVTSRANVIVIADGKKEAVEIAKKRWENGEYVFDETHFVGVAFDAE